MYQESINPCCIKQIQFVEEQTYGNSYIEYYVIEKCSLFDKIFKPKDKRKYTKYISYAYGSIVCSLDEYNNNRPYLKRKYKLHDNCLLINAHVNINLTDKTQYVVYFDTNEKAEEYYKYLIQLVEYSLQSNALIQKKVITYDDTLIID